jgi:hypothetical protein
MYKPLLEAFSNCTEAGLTVTDLSEDFSNITVKDHSNYHWSNTNGPIQSLL